MVLDLDRSPGPPCRRCHKVRRDHGAVPCDGFVPMRVLERLCHEFGVRTQDVIDALQGERLN